MNPSTVILGTHNLDMKKGIGFDQYAMVHDITTDNMHGHSISAIALKDTDKKADLIHVSTHRSRDT